MSDKKGWWSLWDISSLGTALWQPNKNDAVATSLAPPFVVVWTLLGATSLLLVVVKAISQVKIGIARTLGLPIDASKHHHDHHDDEGTGRRLGLLERWYTAHSRAGNHTGVSLAVEMEHCDSSSSSSCPPTAADLRAILHRVALRFPLLRARIYRNGVTGVDATNRLVPIATAEDDERNNTKQQQQRLWGDDLYLWVSHDANREYVRLEECQVERNDQGGEGNGLRAVLQDQTARPWHDQDPSMPLWRVTLVRFKGEETSFALILSFHHAICDGIATTAVVQAIVEESARQNEPPSLHEVLCKNVPPPMEDVLDTVPRICHIWRPLLLDLFPFLNVFLSPSAFSGRPKKKKATKESSLLPQTDNLACFELLDSDLLPVLREACHKRKVTVHTALVATLCKAIAIHVDKVQSAAAATSTSSRCYTWAKGRLWNGNIRFRINTPVNERSRCNPPFLPSNLGCCISATDLFLQVGAHSELSTVKTQYLKLLRHDRQESPMIVGLVAFISQDWLEFSTKRARLNRGDAVDSIDASNVGLVSFKESPSSWKVKRLWMASGRQNPAPALKACWVSTNRSGINLTLGSLPHHFTREDLLSVGSLCQLLLRTEYTNPALCKGEQ